MIVSEEGFSMLTTWYAIAVALLASSVLSRELARKRGRDEYFYFFTGLILGPLAVLIALSPLPGVPGTKTEQAEKPIRSVEGQPCPGCRRQVAARTGICPYCRASLEPAWWEKPVSVGLS